MKIVRTSSSWLLEHAIRYITIGKPEGMETVELCGKMTSKRAIYETQTPDGRRPRKVASVRWRIFDAI